MFPELFHGLALDHIGVTTPDLDLAIRTLAAGGRLLRGPMDNINQGVRQAFVCVGDGPIIELLAPLPDAPSPIARHVREGAGGEVHLCFLVPNLTSTLSAARGAGSALVAGPMPDIAFEQRRIAFLLHPLIGLIEFLEEAGTHKSEPASTKPIPNIAAPPGGRSDTDAVLQEVLAAAFPTLDPAHHSTARLDVTPGWDSLGQLRLIMLLEKRLGRTISSKEMTRLTDYGSVRAFVSGT